MDGIHIALKAEELGQIFGIPITNTLVTSWVVVGLLAIGAFFIGRNIKLIPGKVQSLIESAFEYVLSYMEEVLEEKKAARFFFPFIISLFFFVFASNVLEFIPGVGSIGFTKAGEFIPLFRSVNTDLNVTLALSIIAMLTIQIVGIVSLGVLKYFSKFVSFTSPMSFFIGLIELVSEVARLVSFSFRLFGNIFAGEVVVAVIVFFVPYVFPVPILLFELFVGFIQAAIFALLTLFFIKLAKTAPH